MGTVTNYFTSWSFRPCVYGYEFYEEIVLGKYMVYEGPGPVGEALATQTWHDVCILWRGEFVQTTEHPASYRLTLTGTAFSMSYTILQTTSTSLSGTLLPIPVTVTESHYENVPNPQKFNLQLLAVVLFIASVGGIAVAIILPRRQVSARVG